MIETTKYSPLKIYVDATVRMHADHSATVAAVYKNHNGLTVGKIASQTGNGYTTMCAELEAILRALAHVEHVPQIDHVKCYTDCQPVVDAYHEDEQHNKQTIQSYKDQIARASKHFESCSIEWISREDNGHADGLADMAHSLSTGSFTRFEGEWFR